MRTDFFAQREQIRASYARFTLKKASRRLERQFAFFSANLFNALPHVPLEQYVPIFRSLHLNRRLSFWDVEYLGSPGLVNVQGWDADWAATLKRRPGIICTFHTGSYRLLNSLLAREGVHFSLLVSDRSYQMELEAKRTMYAGFMKAHGRIPDFGLINAEKPQSLFQMAKVLKGGHNLVAYVDGNTGASNQEENLRNLLPIELFGLPARVRKGLAAIAFNMGVPLYPVFCKREMNGDIAYQYAPPVLPHGGEDRDAFSERATRMLYQIVQDAVYTDPAQWEVWLYLHRFLLLDKWAQREGSLKNMKEWGLYRNADKAYFLYRPTYQSYPLEWRDYRILKSCL